MEIWNFNGFSCTKMKKDSLVTGVLAEHFLVIFRKRELSDMMLYGSNDGFN